MNDWPTSSIGRNEIQLPGRFDFGKTAPSTTSKNVQRISVPQVDIDDADILNEFEKIVTLEQGFPLP